MKKLIFLACAFMMISISASAQFVTSSNNAATVGSTNSSVASKIGTFSVSYSPTKLNTISGNSSTSEDFHSVSLTWTNANALHPTQPVYFEYGLGAQWSFMNDSSSENITVSTNFVGVKIPVSLMYKYDVPQTNIALAPYVGLDLNGYLLGNTSAKYGDDKVSLSYFSKDDMGDEKFSRVNLGWHIGARVFVNDLFVGIAYEAPLTNLYKEGNNKINFNYINISLGLAF